jgi:peptidoglycan/xylan/chitin deacetylase (PgdA/CDA1 family)
MSPFVRIAFLAAAFAALPAAAAAAAAGSGGVPVLMYHLVDARVPADRTGRSLTIDPAVFEAQLAWLRAHRIRTLTMNDLAEALERGPAPRDAVVLTFDDGYRDAATVVAPLLRKYGDRASFYVSAGFVGDAKHAGWAQLRAMHAEGMEIGCHGTYHLDLSKLSPAAAQREIRGCVARLTRFVARPTTYAYAAGRYNAETVAILRAAGLKAALTEHWGVVRSLAAPYTLPRRRVARTAGLASFRALATP